MRVASSLILLPICLLSFADLEHLGSASRASALAGRFTILHGNGFDTFHFFLGFALNTISLQLIFLLQNSAISFACLYNTTLTREVNNFLHKFPKNYTFSVMKGGFSAFLAS